jgi:hypothetical protein
MMLLDVAHQLLSFDRELTIYARQPWTILSDAKTAFEGSEEENKVKDEGLIYFLEIFIAQDFISDWKKTQKQMPNDQESCTRLIEYAMNDA